MKTKKVILYLNTHKDPSDPANKVWLNAIFGDSIRVVWVKNFTEFTDFFALGLPDRIVYSSEKDQQGLVEKCANWATDYCRNNAVALPSFKII